MNLSLSVRARLFFLLFDLFIAENDLSLSLTCSNLVLQISKLDGEARLSYFAENCRLAALSASTS